MEWLSYWWHLPLSSSDRLLILRHATDSLKRCVKGTVRKTYIGFAVRPCGYFHLIAFLLQFSFQFQIILQSHQILFHRLDFERISAHFYSPSPFFVRRTTRSHLSEEASDPVSLIQLCFVRLEIPSLYSTLSGALSILDCQPNFRYLVNVFSAGPFNQCIENAAGLLMYCGPSKPPIDNLEGINCSSG